MKMRRVLLAVTLLVMSVLPVYAEDQEGDLHDELAEIHEKETAERKKEVARDKERLREWDPRKLPLIDPDTEKEAEIQNRMREGENTEARRKREAFRSRFHTAHKLHMTTSFLKKAKEQQDYESAVREEEGGRYRSHGNHRSATEILFHSTFDLVCLFFFIAIPVYLYNQVTRPGNSRR